MKEVNIFNSYIQSNNHIKSLPEYKLLIAILDRAILDMANEDDRIRTNAVKWLTSTQTKEFSFIWIAEMLDLKAPALLETIKKFTQVARNKRLSKTSRNSVCLD